MAWFTTAQMMVGSVRGKEMLETPLRVAQGGRSLVLVVGVVAWAEEGRLARSLGGQVRLKPPFTERVGWPHWAQKGLRRFQSMS